MKKSIVLLFTLLFYLPLFSQSFWERAHGPNGLNIKTLKYSAQGVFYAIDYNDRTFRSVDAGLSWEEIKGPIIGLEIRRLQVGFKGTLFCLGEDWNTIYRSTDLGHTWDTLSNLYFSSVFTEAADGGFLIAVEGSILRTYDNIVWDTLYLNPNPGNWNTEIRELGWLPDGTLIASPHDCYSSFSGDRFLISQDNGSSWNSLPGAGSITDLAPLGNGAFIFSSAYCIQAYLTNLDSSTVTYIPPNIIFPEQDNIVATPNGDIIVSNFYESRISKDGGNTWQAYDGNTYNSLSNQVLPGNVLLRGQTFAGATMRSTNLGKTWKFSGYGVEDAWVYDFTFKGADKAFGLTSSGLWRSLDSGEHWQIVPKDSATTSVDFSVYNLAFASNGDLYMLRPYQLQRSTDDGNTFQNISPDSSFGKFARVAVHPQTGDLYLTGDSTLAKSSDQGQSWQMMNTAIRFNYRPIVFHPDGTFYCVAFDPVSTGNTLVRSDDGGISWQYVVVNPPPYNHAYNVQIAPDGKIVAGYSTGFYTSTDNGISWTKHSAPIDTWILKLNALGHVYIADINSKKIYKTKNDGILWEALPNIPSTIFTGNIDMSFDSAQRLWVCTDGDGYFKTLETTVSTSQPEASDFTFEVFPNPAETGFWVKWESEAPVTLTLRDLCGRVISQQIMKTSPAYLPVAEYTSGLYMLELNKDGHSKGWRKVFLK